MPRVSRADYGPLQRSAVVPSRAPFVPSVSGALRSRASAVARRVHISAVVMAVGYAGEYYFAPLRASGGVAPYSWTFVQGSIPPGMTLTGATIAGCTPKAGRWVATLRVTDAAGSQDTGIFTFDFGTDRVGAAAEMMRLINAHRGAAGVAPMALDPALCPGIKSWVDQLAASGSGLVHQSPRPTGVLAHNLSATCSDQPLTADPVEVGDFLTSAWLSQAHSYADYVALTVTDPTAAQQMYQGTGDYAAIGPSGHRICLENPGFSRIGLGLAYAVNGSACGARYPFGYYGGTALA